MITKVEIRRVGQEGHGVGYDAEGNTYFVPGTVPGDTARVEYANEKKRYRDAELIELLSPATTRIEPACPHFGECGGCDYLHWSYSAQLESKKTILVHALERAGWNANVVSDVIASPKQFGYRNRIQVRRGEGKTGFYKRKSHDIVDVEHCAIADPRINESLREIRKLPALGPGSEKIEIALSTTGETVISKNSAHAAAGFRQINAEQNDNLQRVVREAVGADSKVVLELYCGDGNLTFAFLPQVNEVMAIDGSEVSIRLARQRKSETDRVAFLSLAVNSRLLRQLPVEIRRKYDTLVVDPPRQGMDGGLDIWLHPELKKVIYISCSPISFSRDTQFLRENFTLQSVQPLDMFPHTRHVEFVSLFLRA